MLSLVSPARHSRAIPIPGLLFGWAPVCFLCWEPDEKFRQLTPGSGTLEDEFRLYPFTLMSQPSSFSERLENPVEDPARFVEHPPRHEKRVSRRQVRATQRHQPRRHERSEIVVTGSQLAATNVPSSALADELEGYASTISPALARRRERAARKRRRVRRFAARLISLAVVIFVVQSIIAALSAPQFAIAEVEIEGLKATDRATVQAIAAKLNGQNIFRADRGGVEAAVSALPTVKEARVRRDLGWPMRARLVVRERQPLLRVGAGNTWWVADEEGVAFRQALHGQSEDEALYALTSPGLKPETGKKLPQREWERAVSLARALERDNRLATVQTGAKKPFWSLRRLYLDENGLAAVRISGGSGVLRAHDELLVRLGEDKWAAKLKRARQSLDYFERTGRKPALLDLLSLEYPRWIPQPPSENERTESPA